MAALTHHDGRFIRSIRSGAAKSQPAHICTIRPIRRRRVKDAGMPNAWADDGLAGMFPGDLVCVFIYITILLNLGDLAIETGLMTQSQSEIFWSYRHIARP